MKCDECTVSTVCKYQHSLRVDVEAIVVGYSSAMDIPQEFEKDLIDKIVGTMVDQCRKLWKEHYPANTGPG